MNKTLAKFLVVLLLAVSFPLTSFPPAAQAARLWSSGVELATTTQAIEFYTAAITKPSIVTSTVRSGTYALEVNSLTSMQSKGIQHYFLGSLADANGPFFVRTYVRLATLPSAENTFVACQSSGLFQCRVTIDSGGVLRLYDEDAVIATSSQQTISTNTWYRIEIQYDRTAAAGSQTLKAAVDGTIFASQTAGNFSVGMAGFEVGLNLNNEAQTQGDIFFDDLAVNDSTGSKQTTFAGAGSIVHLRPNATGDFNQGVTSTCATIPLCVNEITPDDATAFYTLDVDNDKLYVNLDAVASTTMTASDTVTLVQIGARHSGAAAQSRSHFLNIESQASGTNSTGTTIALGSSAWTTNSDEASAGNYSLTSYTDPQAGGIWTAALLNTAQIGAQCSDAAPDCRITTLWALVEYVPTSTPAVADAPQPATRTGRKIIGPGISR